MAISKAVLIASIAGTAVVAVGLTAGSVWAIRKSGKDFWGNTESTITLRQPSGGACTITGKETEVSVKKNKKITWKVVNYCATAQTVSLGNFRITAAGTQTNCTGATEGGATWPFQGPDALASRQVTVDPADDGDIKQKAKDLGSSPVEFHFDICLGGTKIDPRLVIDP